MASMAAEFPSPKSPRTAGVAASSGQDDGSGYARRLKPNPRKYYLDENVDPLELCRENFNGNGERFYRDFLNDLDVLLTRGRNNVYKWFHQPFATPYGPSGDTRWANIVAFGHTQEKPYLLPTLEAKLASKLEPFFAEAFSNMRPFGIMAGPGTEWAVGAKEIPTYTAANARAIASWDLMPQFANNSARQAGEAFQHIQNFSGVYAIASDFTRPLNGLQKVLGIEPVLISMYGCTLGNDINLTHVPRNFADTIKRKGFYFVTIDGAEGRTAVEGYENPLYKAFQESYWEVAKFMARDEHFDPKAIESRPYYEARWDPGDTYRATIHRHIVVKDTQLLGHKLEAGQELFLGRSHKWLPEDLLEPFKHVGFNMLAAFQEGSVRGVLFAGSETPEEWMQPVRAAIANAQAQNLANVWVPAHKVA